MSTSERLATAVSTSDLAWSDLTTKAVEFVAAMAAASSLGSDLFRAKSYDTQAARRAVVVLTKKAMLAGDKKKLPISRDMAQLMAVAVILEIVKPYCRTCTGAGVSIIDELKVTCPTCGGIMVHRYSDTERARLMGIAPQDWHKWRSRYELVMATALRHDCAPARAGARLG